MQKRQNWEEGDHPPGKYERAPVWGMANRLRTVESLNDTGGWGGCGRAQYRLELLENATREDLVRCFFLHEKQGVWSEASRWAALTRKGVLQRLGVLRWGYEKCFHQTRGRKQHWGLLKANSLSVLQGFSKTQIPGAWWSIWQFGVALYSQWSDLRTWVPQCLKAWNY